METSFKIVAKPIYFSAVNEDRMSLLTKFANGSEFIVRGTNNYEYKLRIESLAREDGGGQRFLFTATMVYAKNSIGLSNTISANYTGYFDAQNKSGWIKSL